MPKNICVGACTFWIAAFTANQDVQAFKQKSNSILPITPFKLKLETRNV